MTKIIPVPLWAIERIRELDYYYYCWAEPLPPQQQQTTKTVPVAARKWSRRVQ